MKVSVRCPVFPTEDEDQILQHISSIFPSVSFDLNEGNRRKWLIADITGFKSLDYLRLLIHDSRIIDTARKIINTSWTGTIFTIKLDKQALTRQKANLIDESDDPPLGFVEIIGHCSSDKEYESFLHWFTPLTKDGKIVRH